MESSDRISRKRFWTECALGIASIGSITYIGVLCHLNLASSGLVYLLAVVVTALYCGFWQATITSIVALGCQLYYFVPPANSWYVAYPQNYVDLAVFECIALLVSRLAAKKETLARQAEQQRNDMERLYRLSRKTLLLDLRRHPGTRLVELIVNTFKINSFALFDAENDSVDCWGHWSLDVSSLARAIHHGEPPPTNADPLMLCQTLRIGSHRIGSVLMRGGLNPLTADAVASLVAITLERYRSFAKEAKAEAAHQSEQFRSMVLDRLAHAFKTPLTAIRTASGGLLELLALSPAHASLAQLIDEQSAFLNNLTTRLLRTAKLESEELNIGRESISIVEMIEQVASEQAREIDGHPMDISIHDRSLTTRGDRELLASVVRQFIDNAAKYSYSGSRIGIAAEESASEIMISVHNDGDPIRLEDRERIFERYYRCPETEHRAPGTGIGLSIAKRAAELHHGHVWVISDRDEGTTFFLSVESVKEKSIEYRQ